MLAVFHAVKTAKQVNELSNKMGNSYENIPGAAEKASIETFLRLNDRHTFY